MHGKPETKQQGSNGLKSVIKGFLREYEFLHEYRLQKLIYILDLLAVEKEGNRITNADFKPFMYGSYSEEIGDALESLERDPEVDTKPDMHHGKTTVAYMADEIQDEEIPDNIEELIKEVIQVTKGSSNDELGNWSKETWLYNNTPYGEEMDFMDYLKNIERGRISSDLEKRFPELFE